MYNGSQEKETLPSARRGEILQKIYRVWLFRKLLPVLVAEIVILSGVLYTLGQTVFVERVIENALNVFFLSPSKIIPFAVAAFLHASALAKILSFLILVLIALSIRHITQGLLRLLLVRENYFSRVKS